MLDTIVILNFTLAYHILLNNIVKRLINLFQATNHTEEEIKEFFNIISKNYYMKNYVQKKSLYNYTDDTEEKEKKSNKYNY